MPLTEKPYIVYKHTNKENGKVYIGITRQESERRWQNGRGYEGQTRKLACLWFMKPLLTRHPTRGKYEHIKQRKPVTVVDTDGTRYEFGSIMDAAEHFGIRANTAARYASGVRSDRSGRRWSACL